MNRRARVFALAAACHAIACQAGELDPAPAARAAAPSPDHRPVDRFIVRLREDTADAGRGIAALGANFGERLSLVRPMSGGAHVARLGRRVMGAEAREVAARLGADPRVLSVEPDLLLRPQAVPNDTMYAQQWNLYETAGGIGMPQAWDLVTGSAAITIGVIDTGVRPHPDLAARLVAGYDFISDTDVSNDGDGRDADPSDPGDYGCEGSTSLWHGTHVAGILGAASNNGSGVAGVDWAARVQPVRVLGRCGGYLSDIVDAMRWTAGMAVPGVPANATPARVENLSLGDAGACASEFQRAIDDVVARGTVVVVAAGNGNTDAANQQPANCAGVITVAATTRSGGRASYSNYGAIVALSAPGGGEGGGVLSTHNAGSTTPGADDYAYMQGTSMATPHVAGVVSLMLAMKPSLTPAEVLTRLRRSARAFPTGTGSDCDTAVCRAGIVDAKATLATLKTDLAAQAPVKPPVRPPVR